MGWDGVGWDGMGWNRENRVSLVFFFFLGGGVH